MASSLSSWDLRKYYRDDFNFNDFKPPFYQLDHVVIAVISYLIILRVSTRLMKNQSPFTAKKLTAIHNLFLFIVSCIMLIGVLKSVFDIYLDGGWEGIAIDSKRKYRAGKLSFWMYVFYLTKPYEFIDTFIMIMKKRELNFLHVWHHCSTFLLVWITMTQEMSIQWLSISVNCFVHCWMYYYYFMASLGHQIWWKRYLTQLQIFQFIATVTINCSWIYFYLTGRNPSGTIEGFYFGMFIITSFLILFINFYIQNYQSNAKDRNPSSPVMSPSLLAHQSVKSNKKKDL